ncbi:MAG: Crp/Fnr family transcriptional regulator [Actinomycetota bacterium]|nr:Crp/Fnr family transcriptional regulator [Actinomycetota bacterium]
MHTRLVEHGANGLEQGMASTPVLATTSLDVVQDLIRHGTVRRYQKGTYLFHQDDEAHEIYFLHEGRVEISSLSSNGDRQLHTAVDPPQFFGELGVLGESRRTATAMALEPSLVWVVPGDHFLRFLLENPQASLALLRALAQQIQAHESLVDDLLFLDLKGRVAKRLLGLVSPSLDELPDDGALVPAVVTHADLASLAGGSRESVTRVLSDFQKREIIGRAGRRYVLKDIKTLSRLAGL